MGTGSKMYVKVPSQGQTCSPSLLYMNLGLTPKAWDKFPVGLKAVHLS